MGRISRNNIAVKIGRLSLKNPVLISSGVLSFGESHKDFFKIDKVGAFVTKTLTLNEREGNQPPRTLETPSGMINSIGLANPGVKKFKQEIYPKIRDLKTKIILSVGGTEKEIPKVIEGVSELKRIDAFEINLSCPNIDGEIVGKNGRIVKKIIRTSKKITPLPMIAKLSPNVDLMDCTSGAVEAGIDGVCIANTFFAMAFDIKSRKPKIGAKFGGLSGPCIHPIIVYWVWKIYNEFKVDIIASGGIDSPSSAIEFLLAGAKAVAIGSGIFKNPRLHLDVLKGIGAFLKRV